VIDRDGVVTEEVMRVSNADIRKLTLLLSLFGTAAWMINQIRQAQR
jgi:RecA/RadA recombinase